MLRAIRRAIFGSWFDVSGWEAIRPGAILAYETWIGGRRAIRSWARREPDPRPALRRLTHWQEVDLAALNRPGGNARALISVEVTDELVPRRLLISTAAGSATIVFRRKGITVRLVDGTRIEQDPQKIALAVPDNAPALFAIYLRLLAAAGRLPGRFTAYLPGTLGTFDYRIETSSGGYCTSLGERIEIGADGWMASLTLSDASDVQVVRVSGSAPRWRQMGSSRPCERQSELPRWGPARDISIIFDRRRCYGRLSSPRIPRAMLLFVGGSGAHDRFGWAGQVDLGYSDIAAQLTVHNIACLLFDKPGAGRTRLDASVARPDFHRAIALAERWLDQLVELRPVGVPLVIAGHSQGGQIAAWLAARRPEIDGLCLLATAARPIDAILREQVGMEAKDLELSDDALDRRIGELDAYFAWVRAGCPAPPPDHLAPMEPFTDWYTGLIETAPEYSLPHVRVPLAILQGGRDIQVPPEEAERLAALLPRHQATVRLFPTLDHLFKSSAKTTNIRAYGDRRRRVARQVADWLASWIGSLSAAFGDQKR